MVSTEEDIFSVDDEKDLLPDDLDTYQKEVLLSIFNLWQIVRQHEDDLRQLIDTLKTLNKNIATISSRAVAANSGGTSQSERSYMMINLIIGGINALLLILLIVLMFIRS